jgi:hypothetical protein
MQRSTRSNETFAGSLVLSYRRRHGWATQIESDHPDFIECLLWLFANVPAREIRVWIARDSSHHGGQCPFRQG